MPDNNQLDRLIKTIFKAGRIQATPLKKMSWSLRLREVNGLLHENIGIPNQYRELPIVRAIISELEEVRNQAKNRGAREDGTAWRGSKDKLLKE